MRWCSCLCECACLWQCPCAFPSAGWVQIDIVSKSGDDQTSCQDRGGTCFASTPTTSDEHTAYNHTRINRKRTVRQSELSYIQYWFTHSFMYQRKFVRIHLCTGENCGLRRQNRGNLDPTKIWNADISPTRMKIKKLCVNFKVRGSARSILKNKLLASYAASWGRGNTFTEINVVRGRYTSKLGPVPINLSNL